MAIPVARVYLGMAHAALPALLPTPPKCNMLPLLPTPPCVAAAILPKPDAKRISRADSDERWDAHKAKPKPSSCSPASSSASSDPPSADSVRSVSAARGSSRKNLTSPLKPGRADSVERWDAHKKAAASSPASSPSSSSSSGTSSRLSSTCPISRASSADRWDVHKKRRSSQAEPPLDDGESSSSTGSNDIDDDEMEEEIVYKPPPPRAMYAGSGFAGDQHASRASRVLGSRCIDARTNKASLIM